MKNKLYLVFLSIIFINSFIYSQSANFSNNLIIPSNALKNDLFSFSQNDSLDKKYRFNFSANFHGIVNSGHANLDNNAEIYIPGNKSSLLSFRLSYHTSWFIFDIEPYQQHHSNYYVSSPPIGASQNTNNHINNNFFNKNSFDIRQSQIAIHYKGFGFGYGKMSHWWGPGFHSAISLSSNAPSQNTYMIGTFNDIKINNFSFGGQIIAIPYNNYLDQDIFFSGLKAHVIYNSNPKITLGFHRTYLSGNFDDLSLTNNQNSDWSLEDAIRLVFEPLFGQAKKDLKYTIIGTQGFDRWDEVLTGFVKINFPNENIEFYLDLASDDNRANFLDLKAHWDHTLGYQLGFKKYSKINNINLFVGIELTSTVESNTFKSSFYRGKPNIANYYAKPEYDYFTYKGRLLGAHSGSSSDDLIFIAGIGNNKIVSFISLNKERHAVKAEEFPEQKYEISFSSKYFMTKNQSIDINLEYERINNFNYKINHISDSKLVWISYSYYFKK